MRRPSAKELGHLEYALRVVFFAFVPFGVVLLAMLVPMTAALVNMVLALSAFFAGELLVAVAAKRPWLRRVLKRQLAFEAFYREHPPRPFLFYIFYPLLLPYVLFRRDTRRELVLFKGYTILAFLVLTVSGIWRYMTVYRPELGFEKFASAFGIGLVIETVAVTMLLMPMTTSVVSLHQRGQFWRLLTLLAVALLGTGIALAFVMARHRTFPSLETRYRVQERTAVDVPRSKAAMKAALETAWKVRRASKTEEWERETDGTVLGRPLDEARAVLSAQLYRGDEAGAFELWTTARKERPAIMILFAEGRRKGRAVWLGMRRDGTVVDKIAEVPKSGRAAMRTAGEL